MEGSLFIAPNRASRAPDLLCGDCGSRFRGRRVTDGVEEVCDACYEARFPASVIEHAQHPQTPARNHLAAD